jgi:hypothetical protein
MDIRSIIQSQYFAALAMLAQVIEKCPEALWVDDSYNNPVWRLVYHALIYTHFYLSPGEADFTPWEKHREDMQLLGDSAPEGATYTQAELMDYLSICLEQVEQQVDQMDLAAGSGFHWLPFSKLELQFYNIRHIMQHTGELYERLGVTGGIALGWVGMKPAAD